MVDKIGAHEAVNSFRVRDEESFCGPQNLLYKDPPTISLP